MLFNRLWKQRRNYIALYFFPFYWSAAMIYNLGWFITLTTVLIHTVYKVSESGNKEASHQSKQHIWSISNCTWIQDRTLLILQLWQYRWAWYWRAHLRSPSLLWPTGFLWVLKGHAVKAHSMSMLWRLILCMFLDYHLFNGQRVLFFARATAVHPN